MSTVKAGPVVDPGKAFKYASNNVPSTYMCGGCGAENVKLWRDYNTFLDNQTLRCAMCSCKEEGKDSSQVTPEGMIPSEFGGNPTDQIGSRIPAVPTEANDTFWGYTSVPEDGVRWWKSLATFPNKKN